VTVPLVLDTDIGTDADDALALALAARHPDIDLRAVTTVSGDARRRAQIARQLLLLAGRDDVEVAAGVGPRSAWLGHEGEGVLTDGDEPEVSGRGAIDLLLEFSEPMQLTTIGPQSNLAAVLERDGAFARRVGRLTVMGGAFRPILDEGEPQPWWADHNLACDPAASVRALNSGFSTVYVPLDVTAPTYLTHEDVERLRGGDELCRVLAAMIEIWTGVLRRLTKGKYPVDRAVALHDPIAVASTTERGFLTVERVPVTIVQRGEHVRTFVDPVEGAPADVVTSVDLPLFREFLLEHLLP
jgi:purine nucleosidase